MLKTTMLRVEIPPMYGNNATAYTHPAFVFKKKASYALTVNTRKNWQSVDALA